MYWFLFIDILVSVYLWCNYFIRLLFHLFIPMFICANMLPMHLYLYSFSFIVLVTAIHVNKNHTMYMHASDTKHKC